MSRFEYSTVWQQLDDPLREEIIAFWNEHGAIPDERVARQRVDQVVALARADDGPIAGICTVARQHVPDLGKELYYYRTFIAPPYRGSFIMTRLVAEAVRILEDYSENHPEDAAAGIYMELENPAFAKSLRHARWRKAGLPFVYIGRTPSGLERRLLWFRKTLI